HFRPNSRFPHSSSPSPIVRYLQIFQFRLNSRDPSSPLRLPRLAICQFPNYYSFPFSADLFPRKSSISVDLAVRGAVFPIPKLRRWLDVGNSVPGRSVADKNCTVPSGTIRCPQSAFSVRATRSERHFEDSIWIWIERRTFSSSAR